MTETSQPSSQDKGKAREFTDRLAVALGARALWALIEKLLGYHFHGGRVVIPLGPRCSPRRLGPIFLNQASLVGNAPIGRLGRACVTAGVRLGQVRSHRAAKRPSRCGRIVSVTSLVRVQPLRYGGDRRSEGGQPGPAAPKPWPGVPPR